MVTDINEYEEKLLRAIVENIDCLADVGILTADSLGKLRVFQVLSEVKFQIRKLREG